MLSPCILPTEFLRRELISAKTDDNGAESGGSCEVEIPNPVGVLPAVPVPTGLDGKLVDMTFLTGKTRVDPESPEPGSLWCSFLVPSPLFGLEPIGAREAPGRSKIKTCCIFQQDKYN